MDKFERFALDVILAEYPDQMGYKKILDYLEEEHDSDEDPEIFAIEEFEDETGAEIARRIEDMRQAAAYWFS